MLFWFPKYLSPFLFCTSIISFNDAALLVMTCSILLLLIIILAFPVLFTTHWSLTPPLFLILQLLPHHQRTLVPKKFLFLLISNRLQPYARYKGAENRIMVNPNRHLKVFDHAPAVLTLVFTL